MPKNVIPPKLFIITNDNNGMQLLNKSQFDNFLHNEFKFDVDRSKEKQSDRKVIE